MAWSDGEVDLVLRQARVVASHQAEDVLTKHGKTREDHAMDILVQVLKTYKEPTEIESVKGLLNKISERLVDKMLKQSNPLGKVVMGSESESLWEAKEELEEGQSTDVEMLCVLRAGARSRAVENFEKYFGRAASDEDRLVLRNVARMAERRGEASAEARRIWRKVWSTWTEFVDFVLDDARLENADLGKPMAQLAAASLPAWRDAVQVLPWDWQETGPDEGAAAVSVASLEDLSRVLHLVPDAPDEWSADLPSSQFRVFVWYVDRMETVVSPTLDRPPVQVATLAVLAGLLPDLKGPPTRPTVSAVFDKICKQVTKARKRYPSNQY